MLSGKHDEEPLTQYTLVAGVRATLNAKKRIQPFVHGMIGRYWEIQTGESASAVAVGGGFDFPVGAWPDVRRQQSQDGQTTPSHGEPQVTTVVRIQGDYYEIGSDLKSYPQVTVQFILRFH